MEPKVLVVDDEPFILKSLTFVLRKAGFEVLERSDYLTLRFGSQHPQPKWTPRSAPGMLTKRLLTKDEHQGVLHRALLAKPRL